MAKKAPVVDSDVVDSSLSEPGAPVSVEEARAIFAERPDVANVLTTEGTLHRDGTLS